MQGTSGANAKKQVPNHIEVQVNQENIRPKSVLFTAIYAGILAPVNQSVELGVGTSFTNISKQISVIMDVH